MRNAYYRLAANTHLALSNTATSIRSKAAAKNDKGIEPGMVIGLVIIGAAVVIGLLVFTFWNTVIRPRVESQVTQLVG
jgi:hypothetical protein